MSRLCKMFERVMAKVAESGNPTPSEKQMRQYLLEEGIINRKTQDRNLGAMQKLGLLGEWLPNQACFSLKDYTPAPPTVSCGTPARGGGVLWEPRKGVIYLDKAENIQQYESGPSCEDEELHRVPEVGGAAGESFSSRRNELDRLYGKSR